METYNIDLDNKVALTNRISLINRVGPPMLPTVAPAYPILLITEFVKGGYFSIQSKLNHL